MANFTRTYRAAKLYIAVATIHNAHSASLSHSFVNDPKQHMFACHPTWAIAAKNYDRVLTSGTWAVLQSFINCRSDDTNDYEVIDLVPIKSGQLAKSLSRALLFDQESRNLHFRKKSSLHDDIFRLRCAQLKLAEATAPFDAQTRFEELERKNNSGQTLTNTEAHQHGCLAKFIGNEDFENDYGIEYSDVGGGKRHKDQDAN